MTEQPSVRLKAWNDQAFCANYGDEAVWKEGLRGFAAYRDLGVEEATGGQFRAHVVRVTKEAFEKHHTTGLHRHLCDFQFNYCLKGWIKFVYEGQEGEFTFKAGDSWLQPAGIVHDETSCSDDVEILEIYSPAVHDTIAVEQTPDAAA